MEQVELTGRVVGEPGALVAGYSSIGTAAGARAMTDRFRVRTDEGLEIEIFGIEAARIEPVETRSVPWTEIERDPIVAPWRREAPAPDATVSLRCVRLHGGDEVALWGVAVEDDFVTEASVAEAGGGTFRAPPVRRLARLTIRVMVIGEEAPERLARLRAAIDREEAKRESAQQRKQRAEEKARAEARAKPDPNAPALGDRLARPYAHVLTFATLAGCLALGAFAPAPLARSARVFAAIAAGFPAVFDALALPRFRALPDRALRSVEIPGTAYVILTLVGGTFLFGVAQNAAELQETAPQRAAAIFAVALCFGAVALGAAVFCLAATQGRRRLVKLLLDAPPHRVPIEDGVWGATDGTVAHGNGGVTVGRQKAVIAHGKRIEWPGTYSTSTVGDSEIRTQDSRSDPLAGAMSSIVIVGAHGRVRVETAGALWLSTVSLFQYTGKKTADEADVILHDTPVRVVGRAQAGVIRRGGVDSLVLFAAPAGQRVEAALRALQWRERIDATLAIAGIAGLLACIVQTVRS